MLGIVFLPGAMTGPILVGVVIAAVVTGLGTLRALTTREQTLLRLSRQVDAG